MKPTVLVTGAGGFIGSHLVETLIRNGDPVRCFIRYNSRGDFGFLSLASEEMQRRMEIVQGDLRDADAVEQAAKDMRVIYHLGAIIPIPYSYVHPREVIEANVMGTLNVLTAARKQGGVRVVHTSTSEVYGTARYAPIDEAHPLQGQSPYAASKIAADKIAESFHLSYDLPVTTVRPFNTFGPRQSTRAIIPTLITQALTEDRVLVGDLTPVRDFNYVENLTDAFVRAGTCDAVVGEVINIGTGNEISIGDLARRVIAIIGREVVLVEDSQRFRPPRSEVRRLIADARRAETLLGWKPTVSLDEGLTRTIQWISHHIDRYRTDRYHI
ncbi:MAG: GDP-mannose 4,6-dehydratase [candidate division Zixibacteria bacterium]|nr:GDP-mannose 4,6-dehydratase [candidate division Zixibacteria bacterium]